jgi:redox-sensitive bicupin YhaK (pirin superfamily)
MITLYERMARGYTKSGWLDSRHTFSFGSYFAPARTGFRSLRVINASRLLQYGGRDDATQIESSQVADEGFSR